MRSASMQRLAHVVGHEDGREPELLADRGERLLQPVARERIERAERFVEQHQPGFGGERARDADALLLTAGQLARVARAKRRLELDELEKLLHVPLADRSTGPAEERRA